MATNIRPEISKDNKYWISKHRYYELKHFCLQYPLWKSAYHSLDGATISVSRTDDIRTSGSPGDPTGRQAIMRAYYADKISLLERIALDTDEYLYKYILQAVTEGLSYTQLKARLNIPCGRDMYYDRYRRFFWLLNEARD